MGRGTRRHICRHDGYMAGLLIRRQGKNRYLTWVCIPGCGLGLKLDPSMSFLRWWLVDLPAADKQMTRRTASVSQPGHGSCWNLAPIEIKGTKVVGMSRATLAPILLISTTMKKVRVGCYSVLPSPVRYYRSKKMLPGSGIEPCSAPPSFCPPPSVIIATKKIAARLRNRTMDALANSTHVSLYLASTTISKWWDNSCLVFHLVTLVCIIFYPLWYF
jgi:hypothetical protein